MNEVREYNALGQIGDVMPAGASHVQVYLVGSGAPGLNGNGSEGGDGGGGGAFACFDVDTTPNTPYTINISSTQTYFGQIKDNNGTTGQSAAWAGAATGKSGAPASSCGNGGYGGGSLSLIHKGGDGAENPGDNGGGGGGGGRQIADGADGMNDVGSSLGGGNGGSPSHPNGFPGAGLSTGASANSGGGGGGGHKSGQGAAGSIGKIRMTITAILAMLLFTQSARADVIEDVYNAWGAYSKTQKSFFDKSANFAKTKETYDACVNNMDEKTAYSIKENLDAENGYFWWADNYLSGCDNVAAWMSYYAWVYNNTKDAGEKATAVYQLTGLAATMQSACITAQGYIDAAAAEDLAANVKISDWLGPQ